MLSYIIIIILLRIKKTYLQRNNLKLILLALPTTISYRFFNINE